MDRRDFLASLAAAGLIPKSWAHDPEPPEPDDFDGWDDEWDEWDDIEAPTVVSEPVPPKPLPEPVRSDGPNAVIVDGVELSRCQISMERDVLEWASCDDSWVRCMPGPTYLSATTADPGAEKLWGAYNEGREFPVAYREDGWLFTGWTGYVQRWSSVQWDRQGFEYEIRLAIQRA